MRWREGLTLKLEETQGDKAAGDSSPGKWRWIMGRERASVNRYEREMSGREVMEEERMGKKATHQGARDTQKGRRQATSPCFSPSEAQWADGCDLCVL